MTSQPSLATRAAETTYRGVWAVLARMFRVPHEPPTLPSTSGVAVVTTRPAPGYLRYVTFQFWIALIAIDILIIGGWIAVLIANPVVGAIIAVPVWIIAIVPDIIAYVAIHLRYDTTWYVISDRSMRIRRGIWIINEITITFENVQNVAVHQGPLQRWFGIANVVVQTAGGGASQGPHGASSSGGHHGNLEGVSSPEQLRDLVMARVNASRHAGLGDEKPSHQGTSALPAAHVEALRAIRDEARLLTAALTT